MNAHLEQRLDEPAVSVAYVVAVEEEEWSGVNDCGAIHQSAEPFEPSLPVADDEWWPGRCIP